MCVGLYVFTFLYGNSVSRLEVDGKPLFLGLCPDKRPQERPKFGVKWAYLQHIFILVAVSCRSAANHTNPALSCCSARRFAFICRPPRGDSVAGSDLGRRVPERFVVEIRL